MGAYPSAASGGNECETVVARGVGGDVHAGGLPALLGRAAWQTLPLAVRARFREPPVAVDYHGRYEIVRASRLGRVLALVCRLLGTPIVPRTGADVAAVVRVSPRGSGVQWLREYHWRDGRTSFVVSTKVLDARDGLVERLPARLCMPLTVAVRDGVLHFTSRGYWFDLGTLPGGRRLRLPLPALLSPGITHVEHEDLGDGSFRFTMTVVHPRFGELYFQTGRFRAAQDRVP